MEAKLERNYSFLKNKYNELLLPTFFMVMSEKICVLIDMLIIGIFLGSTQLSVINLATPLTYITGIFYMLFGQGCSLLALRAQAQLQREKMNYYFTYAIVGIILISLIYILAIFLFMDNVLIFFNVPGEIFNLSKQYLSFFILFLPLNCYVLVISFFVRSDGKPKIPFYSVLVANILNIFFDLLFLGVFHWEIESTALASILGYLVGSIYVTKYLFDNNSSFKLISLFKFKIMDSLITVKEIILNTPEVIGKICFSIKMIVLTYLCSTYFGVSGLLALLIYDNSETFVYMFLSGIMKTMSPIVTVLHKEMDFEAVHYIIVRSIKQILLISFPVSVLFFIFPELLLFVFNIDDPSHVEVVILAIRITAFSLVGRCMNYLLSNYAQAIEQNKISSIVLFLEEFLFAVSGAFIFTNRMGGIGIWVSILIADCLPVLIYIIYTLRIQKSYKNQIDRLLLIQNSKLVTWTYNRQERNKLDKYLDESSKKILIQIENLFKDDAILISNSIYDICENIFENNEEIQDIDLTIRLIDGTIYVVLTTDGRLYNPFSDESLMKSDNVVELSKLNCEFDYGEVLGFNREYIVFNK